MAACMHGTCRTHRSGQSVRAFDYIGLRRRSTIASASLRHAGRFLRRAAVVLGEDDPHPPLDRRARRARARGDPVVELRFGYLQEPREPLAPALQEFALLEDARAHLRPPRMLVLHHGDGPEQAPCPEPPATGGTS